MGTRRASPKLDRDNNADEIATALGHLANRANRLDLYDSLVEGIDGVTPTNYPVFSGLGRIGPTTTTELAKVVGLDRSVATRYATGLEHFGLVARSAHPSDSRSSLVQLTPKGRNELNRARRRLKSHIASVLGNFTDQETYILAHGLTMISESFANSHGTLAD